MDNTPITIDLTYFYSLTNGDKDFEQLLLNSAVTDLNKSVNGLKLSWDNKDAAGIRKSAHSLIALAAIAGMPMVESWCRKIERAYTDNNFYPELAVMVNDIVSGWPAMHMQLKELMVTG